MAKLARGHLDLHSGRSSVEPAELAELLADMGASDDMVGAARRASAANHVLELARQAQLPLGDRIAAGARSVALGQIEDAGTVEVLIFDRAGALIGRAAGW
jgi:cobalt-precorrin-5B (C1)-methyltransferase